jgi:hypothetical protein
MTGNHGQSDLERILGPNQTSALFHPNSSWQYHGSWAQVVLTTPVRAGPRQGVVRIPVRFASVRRS